MRFVFDWRLLASAGPSEPPLHVARVGAIGYQVLVWVLRGHHTAVRSPGRVRPPGDLVPWGVAELVAATDDDVAAVRREFSWWQDVWREESYALRSRVVRVLASALARLDGPVIGSCLSPPSPAAASPVHADRRVPSFYENRSLGGVVVTAFAEAGDPVVAGVLGVLARRLWLSLDTVVPRVGAPLPPGLLFVRDYAPVAASSSPPSADLAELSSAIGNGVVPVVAVPWAAPAGARGGSTLWARLARVLRTVVVFAPPPVGVAPALARLVAPGASAASRRGGSRGSRGSSPCRWLA